MAHTAALADLTTTITTGGSAQPLSSTPQRTTLVISNSDASEDLWVAFFGRTAAPYGLGSILIRANGGFLSFVGDAPGGAISVYAGTSGHKVTAWEG